MTPTLERLLAVMTTRRADEDLVLGAYGDFLRDFGLDHFTLGVMEGADDALPERLHIWTSLPDAWMAEYHARNYAAHDYVIGTLNALGPERPLAVFEWGEHTARQPGVTASTRDVLHGVADAGLGAAMTFGGRSVENGRERCFAASFGCTSGSMEETARRIERHRNELVIASFAMAPLLAPALDRRPTGGTGRLSGRERDVLARFAQGLRPDRIAERMGLSKRTVDMHATNARRKLGARTIAEAVAIAVRGGVI